MRFVRSARQGELFDRQPDLFDRVPEAEGQEPPPADFIDRIRAELQQTLARVRAASVLPWSDLTRTYLAELRFHSIARWLGEEEATALRTAFSAEMKRLYEAAGETAPEVATFNNR